MNSSNYYDKLPAAASPQIIVVEIRGFHEHFSRATKWKQSTRVRALTFEPVCQWMKLTKSLLFQTPSITPAYIHHTLHKANGLDYAAHGRLIQHCTDHRLLRQGKQLHARLLLSAVVLDNFLASKLITFYSKSGHLREAHRVFDEIPHRNTFSWNALLIGYCSCYVLFILPPSRNVCPLRKTWA